MQNPQNEISYQQYLLKLTQYLTEFYKKTNPLVDFKKEVEDEFTQTFEDEWAQGSLYGWEQHIN